MAGGSFRSEQTTHPGTSAGERTTPPGTSSPKMKGIVGDEGR